MSRSWQRLAQYVVSRRNELGMTSQRQLSERSGVSPRTVGTLERGAKIGLNSVATLERALQWEPGSAESVLAGGKPTLLAEQAPTAEPGSKLEEALELLPTVRRLFGDQAARDLMRNLSEDNPSSTPNDRDKSA